MKQTTRLVFRPQTIDSQAHKHTHTAFTSHLSLHGTTQLMASQQHEARLNDSDGLDIAVRAFKSSKSVLDRRRLALDQRVEPRFHRPPRLEQQQAGCAISGRGWQRAQRLGTA